VRDLCRNAVDAALGAGASYADARGVFRRSQSVATKNGNVEAVSDLETEGIGVRVLVDGSWGFAGAGALTDESAREAALRACAFARAAGGGDRKLHPLGPQTGTFETPVEIDPFSISLDEKIDFCLEAERGLARPEVKVAEAFVHAQREHKVLVSSDSVDVEQEHVECGAGIDATAVSKLPVCGASGACLLSPPPAARANTQARSAASRALSSVSVPAPAKPQEPSTRTRTPIPSVS